MPATSKPTYRIACHVSEALDTDAAAQEVVAGVAPQMAGETDLVVVYFSGHHVRRIDAVTSALYDALAPRTVIGASAVSVAGNDVELEGKPGLSVLAASWPGVELRTFTDTEINWPHSANDPAQLRAAVGGDRPDLRGILFLADPFTPVLNVLPAISESLRRSPDQAAVPIFGGIASAGRQPGDNRLLRNDEIRNGGIVGLSIFGPIRIDTLVSQGCRPIGRPLVITAAKRNLIQTLGGKPALQVFQELAPTFSEEERELISKKGLFVGRVVNEYRDRFGRGDFLIRNVIGVDREHGYIAVSDMVKVGQTIQFHVRDAKTAQEDLELLLAAQQLDDTPLGGLLFTCNGRGEHLFGKPHADVTTIRKALPGMPLAGCFAAGEIGPVGDAAYLHGHTASMALFRGV